ncbi:MAG: sulfite exporter TauE/SafE family protein [Chloroflexi bacterium]|nr:sulfite exporter TauE/SafE family protein [Chloroflexota bacterium]MBK6711448.1 sulfite exporter TauE/SafE family protein [Chloroflexota bacterium]MBK7176692.1 sulfite exporter TauE/SafE family protein [Chloroflexota bacterium]MBK8935055.1 sulfite exporter TauE/SafE family protein [Chloroflexota bacterium]MBP7593341.1 sulfite exporter TauE/SafE family protein [Chloroflexota bacterium]
MMPILVFIIVFVAIFVQAVTGFGLALVSMPLLVLALDIQVASPLVALIGGVAELLLLLHYRADLNIRAVTRLVAASLLGIPVGVLLLRRVDVGVITAVLGLLILLYALYALSGLRLPRLAHQAWGYGFGFVAGVLGGAYNISGPPVIIYGNCRQWPPAEFKSNLQGFFVVSSYTVIAVHALSGNFSPAVWQNFLIALPAILLALFVGLRLDNHLNPERFRRIVLVVLVVLGASLLFG